jgi:Na+/H+ antiporter NhaD/arsenite permease-like protein
MELDEKEALTDKVLLIKSLGILALTLFGFIVGHGYGFEPGSIALFCAALLLLLDGFGHKPEKQSKKVHYALNTVEWETIFFFIGLFILVYAVEEAGLLSLLAQEFLSITKGDIALTGMLIIWVSAIASAIVDNIPFVATMIPLIKAMGPELGGDAALMPLWWCLSLGACLGGNGSLVGASANVIVAGFAERAGQRISFMKFLIFGFPLMIATVVIASVYAWFVFLT